ncbi:MULTISPECIES: helix-turn-helix domain-containing protein [Sphingomonas]|uniref:AlbA family DNA-binding domain-containing protein n=1 Tax=Sphingomonas TaxID=13687 RepID=UPI000832CBB6|nr:MULTISPECIES: ATP-binding protein [Sphingomonas]MBY0301189.1 ATP-binding protein [Sphingomonas ginsenosidimutans]
MNTEDIEALLTGAEETDALEFKGAVSWDRNLFVKDILAMANVIDGGRIVIGVEDGTFVRLGLSAEQVASYRIDEMRDGIAPFADPRAVFRMETVTDAAGLRFVVIEVSPFEDVPVICKRDGADVRAGVVYFRSRTRRPESAAVANSTDMRDLVERSAALSARRLRRIGFVPELQPGPDYDAELGGL